MLDQGLHTVVENVRKVGGRASRKDCAKWKGGQHSLERVLFVANTPKIE